MKNICLNPVFTALQGNYNSTDEHGHKGTFRFRETSWGKKYFGIGPNPKRNTVTHPYSAEERQQHDAFKSASQLRSLIVKNAALRKTWETRFKKDVSTGATKCNTLTGYLQQQAMRGMIQENGSPLE